MSLDRVAADKLVKICRLFSSDKLGERAAAAAMADALLRKLELTWDELINRASEPSTDELIDQALEAANSLTEWERKFLAGVRRLPTLTEKQLAALHAIVAKISARKVAA